MTRRPSYNELLEAMKRLADPNDQLHARGPLDGAWQALAQTVVFGRVINPEEWWDAGWLSVEQMLAKTRTPEKAKRPAPNLLSERNKCIHAARLDGRSFAEIAKEFGLTEGRAGQLNRLVEYRLAQFPGHAAAFKRWKQERDASRDRTDRSSPNFAIEGDHDETATRAQQVSRQHSADG